MVHVCFYVYCVAAIVEDSGLFEPWSIVVCLCKGCDGCCVFCLYCDTWSCRCSCMGSMSVLSYRCCISVNTCFT